MNRSGYRNAGRNRRDLLEYVISGVGEIHGSGSNSSGSSDRPSFVSISWQIDCSRLNLSRLSQSSVAVTNRRQEGSAATARKKESAKGAGWRYSGFSTHGADACRV